MGLFDALRGQREVVLTPRAAMLLACISMVSADGDIGDDEIAVIRRIDGSASNSDWQKALEAWKRVSGPNECVNLTAPHLNADQRRFTGANLIDIAMADGLLAGAADVYAIEHHGVVAVPVAGGAERRLHLSIAHSDDDVARSRSQ